MPLFIRPILLLYFSVLIYIVFFAQRRQDIVSHSNTIYLIPLKNTVDSFYSLQDHNLKARLLFFFSNFFGNIFLFFPLPFFIIEFFKVNNRKFILVIGIFTSLLIEFSQFYWHIGVPDIDDVLLNTIGVILGILPIKSYLKKIHPREN